MTDPVQQITKQNFIRLGILAFKEHELREIVAAFCRLPGIAPQPTGVAQQPQECLALIDARLADLREANDIFRKSSWDRGGDIQRNDREIRWLIDFRTTLTLPSTEGK